MAMVRKFWPRVYCWSWPKRARSSWWNRIRKNCTNWPDAPSLRTKPGIRRLWLGNSWSSATIKKPPVCGCPWQSDGVWNILRALAKTGFVHFGPTGYIRTMPGRNLDGVRAEKPIREGNAGRGNQPEEYGEEC